MRKIAYFVIMEIEDANEPPRFPHGHESELGKLVKQWLEDNGLGGSMHMAYAVDHDVFPLAKRLVFQALASPSLDEAKKRMEAGRTKRE